MLTYSQFKKIKSPRTYIRFICYRARIVENLILYKSVEQFLKIINFTYVILCLNI